MVRGAGDEARPDERVLITARQIDEAADLAGSVTSVAPTLTSARVRHQLHHLVHILTPYSSHRSVTSVLARYQESAGAQR